MMSLTALLIFMQQFFIEQHGLFLSFVGVLGLIIGSFINVVAHRIPIIMMNEWRADISEFITHDDNISPLIKQQISAEYQNTNKISLSAPRSSCPHCHTIIAWYHNIPIISYLILAGRCASCSGKISAFYPLTELVCASLSVLIAHHFGVSIHTLLALILVWFLLALSLIDLKVQLLPDRLLLPVGMIGLLANVYSTFASTHAAIIGLMTGFVSFWLINVIFKRLTQKDGMGLGDAKLLGVLGAWLGVQFLPMIVFISALLGVLASFIITPKRQAFAFGPYLAIGGVISLLYGESILAWYLSGF